MEKSQEIFKQLKELEKTRDGIEMRWRELTESAELAELVHRLLVAERIDLIAAKSLREDIAKRLKARDAEKDFYLSKWGALRKELFILTLPAIMDYVKQIGDEIVRIRTKRVSEIIGRKYLGIKKTMLLRVRSNDDQIRFAIAMAEAAIKKLQEMRIFSIPMIETEGKTLLESIRGVDISKTTEKEIDEVVYFKGKTPEGFGPSTTGYAGPLSGVDLPPIQKIDEI